MPSADEWGECAGTVGAGAGTPDPTVPRSERGRGARARGARRKLPGGPAAPAVSSAPEPGCAGTPSGGSTASPRRRSVGAAGERSVRLRQVSCSIGLRCIRPMYSEPGVCSAIGAGEPSPPGEARWRRRRMDVPLAMSACSDGGASPGRGEAGGVESGEPSSGLLAGVAVGVKCAREGGTHTDSRRECTGEPPADERRDVSRELHALPSTLLDRLLMPLLHTLLAVLLTMLPSFGWSTVLNMILI